MIYSDLRKLIHDSKPPHQGWYDANIITSEPEVSALLESLKQIYDASTPGVGSGS